MIKGSTKVGEIFLCAEQTHGVLEVLPDFLGKAITGLGGGCSKMFVIEEGEGYTGIVTAIHHSEQEDEFQQYASQDDNKVNSARQQKGSTHERFGMTPFDHQQNFYQLQKPITNVDQKIEERESLRHSTHRSQRSDRVGGPMHQTATGFGGTDNMSENQDRPGFQQHQSQQQYIQSQDGAAEHEIDQEQNFSEMHQIEQQEGVFNDEEPSKMFTFEENQQQQEMRVASQRSSGQRQKPFTGGAPSRTQQQENMGHLTQICCGKQHTLQLTRDGDVFSYGAGLYSAAGHGGSKTVLIPTVLKPLREKRIAQVACGEFHSLVLTDKGDVYSWGRGFEGQLGLSKSSTMASTPSYIKSFYGKPVTYIAAGAFYSLAITKDCHLWGWGEAKLGQLGIGKQRIVQLPQRIPVCETEQTVQTKPKSIVQAGGDNELIHNTKEVKVVQCSAGFGHTAALSEDGELFMWGFNVYGQLGTGDKKSRWNPVRIERDILGNHIARLVKVKCSYYATYAIDEFGHPYSWGKGFIGHRGETIEELPRQIELNTDNRIFTDIYTNQSQAILYAPIRVFSISPNCGPAHGGTIINIIGTGFVNSEKLKVRFTYGDLSQEVLCQFDPKNKFLFCKTPKFEEFEQHPSLKLPCSCILSVTMDGINYSECEEPYKIYSNDIFLTQINPKCGSVRGGTELTLLINIDEVTAQNLANLNIGFQPKRTVTRDQSKKTVGMSQGNAKSYQSLEKLNQSNQSSVKGSRANLSVTNKEAFDQNQNNVTVQGSQDKPINPLDLSLNDAELYRDNWTCTAGTYENGKIICIVPELENFDQESLQFNVDVALNGQQYTGRPLPFRYYDIYVERIEPSIGLSEGGTVINIMGVGLYDSPNKRVKFEIEGGERIVTASWDRKLKCLQCIVPPLTWLFGGAEISEEELEIIKKKPVNVLLTFNNQEWIPAKEFYYQDCKVDRIAYAQNYGAEIVDPIEKDKHWRAEESLERYPDEMPEEEKKKKDDEKHKKAEEEAQESQTAAKRKGVKMFVYGNNFLQTDVRFNEFKTIKQEQNLIIRFNYNGIVTKDVHAIYKNSRKLACEIPDMGSEVPVGHHPLKVEVSLNGQQFSTNGVSFLYNSVDPNLSEEELKKMDEAEEKAKGKPGAAKKNNKHLKLKKSVTSPVNRLNNQQIQSPSSHFHSSSNIPNPNLPRSANQQQYSAKNEQQQQQQLKTNGSSSNLQNNYTSQGQPGQNNYQTYMNSFMNENDMNSKQKENIQRRQVQIAQTNNYNSKNTTISQLNENKPQIRVGIKQASTPTGPSLKQLQNGSKDRLQALVSLDPRALQQPSITPQPQIIISDTFRGIPNTKSYKDLQSPLKKNSMHQQSIHETKKSLTKDGLQTIMSGHSNIMMVKSAIDNSGRNQVNNNHHQILGFYSNNNNTNTHDLQLSPPSGTKDSTRMILAVDKVKEYMISTQPNFNPQIGFIDARSLPIANGSKMKRNINKDQLRSNVNLKIQSSNNQSSTFDSIECLSTQINKTYSNTTKHGTNRQINISQSMSKLIPNDSQNAIAYAQRSGLYDYSNELSSSQVQSRKYQAKIQKMGGGGMNPKSSQQLSGSLSSALLSRDSSGVRTSSGRRQANSKQALFRPHSLKQLMPTIDEQIMRLTEMGGPNGQQSQDYQSTQFLFKTLQNNSKQNQNSRSQQATHHTNSTGSQFRGQQIIPKTSQSPNKTIAQFVQEQAKQQQQLLQAQQIKSFANDSLEDNHNINNMSSHYSLKIILEKSGKIMNGYAEREKILVSKCQEQQQDIEYLKERLRQYENVL